METCAKDEELSGTQEWFHPKVEPDEKRRDWYARDPALVPRRSSAVARADLANRFDALRIAWHREYGPSSSFTEITRCPSYREIVQLGDSVLPFIFRDLERRPEPDHWFDALVEITKADPVPAKDRGYSRRMAKAWLKWARAHGHA